MRGFEGLDVEDRVRIELIGTYAERGFIGFARAGRGQGIETVTQRWRMVGLS